MMNTREVDGNGNEKNFATNTLGTHLLTTTLIPVLSKYIRLININSEWKSKILLSLNIKSDPNNHGLLLFPVAAC